MKPKWLIEDYEHDSSIQPLLDEIKKQGMEFKIVKYEPWESGEFNQFTNDDCVIFYGTINLGMQLQKDKSWVPGVYFNFQNICCVTYYSYWAKYLFNQDYIMLPFLEIKRRENYVFETFGIDNCIFIRPDSGAKTFTGQILKREEIDRTFDLFESYAAKPLDEIITLISSPKIIDKEWRCVVVDKKVIAFSQYRKENKLNIKKEIDTEAFCLADKIAKEKWQPDITYSLDICLSDGKYSLLEANSFSCSGLYESDPEPIVKEISKVAINEWKKHNE